MLLKTLFLCLRSSETLSIPTAYLRFFAAAPLALLSLQGGY